MPLHALRIVQPHPQGRALPPVHGRPPHVANVLRVAGTGFHLAELRGPLFQPTTSVSNQVSTHFRAPPNVQVAQVSDQVSDLVGKHVRAQVSDQVHFNSPCHQSRACHQKWCHGVETAEGIKRTLHDFSQVIARSCDDRKSSTRAQCWLTLTQPFQALLRRGSVSTAGTPLSLRKMVHEAMENMCTHPNSAF